MASQRSVNAQKSKDIQMLLKMLSNTTVPKKLWEALCCWIIFIVEKLIWFSVEKIDRTKVGLRQGVKQSPVCCILHPFLPAKTLAVVGKPLEYNKRVISGLDFRMYIWSFHSSPIIKESKMEPIRVVIVEDDPDIRQSFETIVGSAPGFDCIKAFVNAEDAVEGIPALRPDVVIMDIHLPGMTGIEAVQLLKEQMPALQIAMCTVYEDDEHIFNALKAGASGYLLKRTSPEKLLEALHDLHQGGSPMSGEIARRVVNSFQRKAAPSPELAVLTAREKEILDLLAKGYLYKEIAAELFISIETVKRHIHNIYEKLHVQTRTEALNKVFRMTL